MSGHAVAALVLFVVWVLLAGVGRMALQRRRTGDSGFRFAAAAGVVATYLAQLAMGTAWRIGVDPTERTDLVTSGPFALVRNPIFTAALITFTGLAFTTPNLVALSGLVVVHAGIQMQVRAVEEPHLLATHGQAYAHYAARVGRFLPWIGRLRRP